MSSMFNNTLRVEHVVEALDIMRRLELFSPIDSDLIQDKRVRGMLTLQQSSLNWERYLCHKSEIEVFRR